MLRPSMRAILLLPLLVGCTTSEGPEPFHFMPRFGPGDHEIIIDGIANPTDLDYAFDDYETARRELRLDVEVRRDGASKFVELRPGVCWDDVLPLAPRLGRLLQERVAYGVLDADLALFVSAHECVGTGLTITTTP